MISTRRKLVEPDVDTEEAAVSEVVRRWPDAADSGSLSPDSGGRSSISFKPKEPTLSSLVVVSRAMRTDDQLVPTITKDRARRAGRQQIGAQRGAMVSGGAAGEDAERSSTADLSRFYGEVMTTSVGAELRTEEPNAVEDEIGDGLTSAVTKRRVQQGALSAITAQRTIATRQHPVNDETDPDVTFKTLPRATAVSAKPSSRKTATRGGIVMISGRVTDWAQGLDIGLNTSTRTPTFGRGVFTPIISWRGAMALSGSGRDIMRLYDQGYIRVKRNELAMPGRSGRPSRASGRPSTSESWKANCGKR